MYKDKKIIAIIPARSGSKGLPDKNIKDLKGKPLIAYTIEAAVKSKCFNKVFVSTDSEEYAKISKDFGAEVPFLRSNENSNDTAGSWIVCEEVLNKLEEEFDMVVLLQPTSPLRNAQHIQEAIDLFFLKNAEVVVSVTSLPHPIEWCNQLPSDNSLKNFIPTKIRTKRRQDLPKSYTMNGAIYIIKSELIKPDLNLCGENSYAYIMEEAQSVDIDSEFDFLKAQMLLNTSL